jgi:hypothetical protein
MGSRLGSLEQNEIKSSAAYYLGESTPRHSEKKAHQPAFPFNAYRRLSIQKAL